MEEAKLAILTDAKQEYSLQLVNILKTPICTGLRYLYDEAKKKCVAEDRFNEVLAEFQEFLSQIRLWSQNMIESEYSRIEEESGCDFIKELITAVFMSHTQILQAIQGNNKQKQNQIDIPKPEHFLHKCYINAGREFYKNPFFFYDGPDVSSYEKQRNIPQCETIIATSINETIRQLLPVRRILKTYLSENYNPELMEEEERKESMKGTSKSYQNNLREIVKKEIQSLNDDKNEKEQLVQTLMESELEKLKITPSSEIESISGSTFDEEKKKVLSSSPQLEVPLNQSTITITTESNNNDNNNSMVGGSSENLEINTNTLETISIINTDNTDNTENTENTDNIDNDDIEKEFEALPELSLDDIDEIVTQQDHEFSLYEKEEKERLEKERLEKERLEKERLEKEKLEKERLESESNSVNSINSVKNVLMDSENKKTKQDSKNSEIKIEKHDMLQPKELTSIVHPASLQPEIPKKKTFEEEKMEREKEASLYANDLDFDEEINLVDDIILDPPTKSIIPPTQKKFKFF